jgi:hypothetical protein
MWLCGRILEPRIEGRAPPVGGRHSGRPILFRQRVIATWTIAGLIVAGIPASARTAPDPKRSPQVMFCPERLQTVLDSLSQGLGGQYALADQLDLQVRDWASVGTTARMFFEPAFCDPGASYGVYSADSTGLPVRVEVIPAGAPGHSSGFVVLKESGSVTVVLSDSAGFVTNIAFGTLPAQSVHRLGFYEQVGGHVWYSQDSRNGGLVSELTYEGYETSCGLVGGTRVDAFESHPDGNGCADFADAVILTCPDGDLPTQTSSWGAVKTRYR